MARYADGFVLPVPKRNLDAYKRIARKAGKIWREHGALQYCETLLDDAKVQPGCGIPITKSIEVKRGETVVFAWIVYRSKAHRDKVNALVVADPRLADLCDPKNLPFDINRMAYAGFEVIVDA